MIGTKWSSLAVAVGVLLFTLWFCTDAGFPTAFFSAIVLMAVGIFVLRSREPSRPPDQRPLAVSLGGAACARSAGCHLRAGLIGAAHALTEREPRSAGGFGRMAARIAVTKERRSAETRVAATPDTVKKLIALGFEVVVETGAGAGASIPDADFTAAGATIAKTGAAALSGADVVLKVRAPLEDEIAALKSGAIVVSMLDAYNNKPAAGHAGQPRAFRPSPGHGIRAADHPRPRRWTCCLSSQANLAGYRAVVEAAEAYEGEPCR